jgi:hypothetical protein
MNYRAVPVYHKIILCTFRQATILMICYTEGNVSSVLT